VQSRDPEEKESKGGQPTNSLAFCIIVHLGHEQGGHPKQSMVVCGGLKRALKNVVSCFEGGEAVLNKSSSNLYKGLLESLLNTKIRMHLVTSHQAEQRVPKESERFPEVSARKHLHSSKSRK
jgi:hypothetical protein